MKKKKSRARKPRRKTDPHDSLRRKVSAIFFELAGDRSCQLEASIPATEINEVLAAALRKYYPAKVAREIAFHLVDWNSDAAFLVAVYLFPERFSPEEIRCGIYSFLPHVPSHVMAAARLAGYSTDDIFVKGYKGPEGSGF
jgi:hypothetical protein